MSRLIVVTSHGPMAQANLLARGYNTNMKDNWRSILGGNMPLTKTLFFTLCLTLTAGLIPPTALGDSSAAALPLSDAKFTAMVNAATYQAGSLKQELDKRRQEALREIEQRKTDAVTAERKNLAALCARALQNYEGDALRAARSIPPLLSIQYYDKELSKAFREQFYSKSKQLKILGPDSIAECASLTKRVQSQEGLSIDYSIQQEYNGVVITIKWY